MGSFAGFLGDAAKGFASEARLDTQRQFDMEHDRRAALTDLLGKLANDPTAHPETQQAALQGIAAIHSSPWNKPIKAEPIINSLITRGPQQPTQTATTPGAAAAPQHDLTNLIPKGQPMPTPPTSAGMPAPAMPQQAQFTPPPNMGMRYTPAEQAGIVGQAAGAEAGGQLRGQIGARQEALQGIPLPPEQKAAMTIGMPGYAGLIGAYGAGDVMPVSAAQLQGVPVPQGVDPNGWVRVQRNKLGQIIGSYPTNQPAAYAPTESQGFTYQTDAQGNTIAVPVTTVRQKQLPIPPGSAPAKPEAKVSPTQGTKVGKMKPPQALLIAPPTALGEQPTAIAARPGTKVPAGAVTAQGYSSVNVPTSGTRTRAEFAQGLLPQVDRISKLITHAAPKLGAIKGRYNEFIAGKLGGGLDDDPEISALRTDIGLLQTGMMVPHVGARGGVMLISKFKNLLDSGKASATQLNASLGEMKQFLTTYSKEGQLKGWGTEPANAPDTSWHAQFGGAVR